MPERRCVYCGDDEPEHPYQSCCGEIHFEDVCEECDEGESECTCNKVKIEYYEESAAPVSQEAWDGLTKKEEVKK